MHVTETRTLHKSYRPRDVDGPPGGGGRNPTVNLHGEKRNRDMHESKTDKDAYQFRKSKVAESKLAYLWHLLMENRHGLVVNAKVTQSTGKAKREAAVALVETLGGSQPITLGADKYYDTRGFVKDIRGMMVTPHVARNDTNRLEEECDPGR